MPSQIRNLKRKLSGFAVITLLSCALAALSFHLAWFPDLEGATWDWRTRYIARRAQPDPNIKIIAVDQHSLDFYAAAEDSVMLWPWPRSIYGAIVEYLRMAGARGVAFDILFSEQSFSGVEEDQQFADSIAGAMPVVQAVALQSSKARNAEDPRLELLRARQLESERSTNFVSRLLNSGDLPEYLSAVMPVRPLLEKSHAFGSVTSSAGQESGELFRFAELGGALNGIPILSLPFALYNGAVPREQQRFNPADFVTGDGRLILRFFGPTGSIKTYSSVAIIQSYANILEEQAPAVPLAEFKNALVFVGLTAPGLMDIRPTALSSNFPGVEVNATALDNILHQRFIRMLPDALELLGIALFVSALSALSIFVVSLRNQVVLITSVLVIFALAAFKAADLGYWVPIVPFILGMLFSILSSQAFMYQLEGKQHRFIKDAFKFYVSPAVIDKIIEEPELLALGGERRELSMFFSDIAGFTSISESIEASKLVPLINRFLSAMTQVIQKTGGTVDKYVGDAIVAFWNAPIPQPDHALRAVNAALECQRVLASMQAELQRDFGVGLKMRVGLNTGVVSVGNFGSDERFNYTIIGDAANLASRLEGANKYFGTYILMTGETMQKLGGQIPCRKVAEVKVVGKSAIVPVYEPLSPDVAAKSQSALEIFNQSLALFEKGELEQACQGFQRILQDPVARIYLTRAQRDIGSDSLKKEWSAVWQLGGK